MRGKIQANEPETASCTKYYAGRRRARVCVSASLQPQKKAEPRPAPARVNCSCRSSRGTAIKKRRSERKGRRSFDTAIEYVTVATMARERTRTATSTVRAT